MRQKSLFPGVELGKEELDRLISPLYPKLWEIMQDPFRDLRNRRQDDPAFMRLDEGATAQWLRPQIVDCAEPIFTDDPEVTSNVNPKTRQFYLEWGEKFVIIPKKLRRTKRGKLTFSSYKTLTNEALWEQLEAEGLPELPRLLVGYLFNELMTNIKVYVAYPRGKSAGIYLLMPDQDGGITATLQPNPIAPDDDKGYTITPRKKRLPKADES